MTTPSAQSGGPRGPEQIALAAASAAGAVMPSSEPLEAPGVQPGSEQVTLLFAGAVVANLSGPSSGVVGLLIAEELVSALAESPMGELDLAAAVQPAFDAAAAAVGASIGAARTVEMDRVITLVAGGEKPFTVVPLVGDSIAAAMLAGDETLAALSIASGAPATPAAPAPAAPVAAAPAAPSAPPPPSVASAMPPIAAMPPVVAQAMSAAPMPPIIQPLISAGHVPGPRRGIELLNDVDMEVTVELGRTRMAMRDLLALTPGHVLELDRAAGAPADLLVNGHLIARGEVVVVDEDFGLRVTEILETSTAG